MLVRQRLLVLVALALGCLFGAEPAWARTLASSTERAPSAATSSSPPSARSRAQARGAEPVQARHLPGLGTASTDLGETAARSAAERGQPYYDPRTSAWQSTDPALDMGMAAEGAGQGVFRPATLSLYAYCSGDPLGRRDPSGAQDGGYARMLDRISEDPERAQAFLRDQAEIATGIGKFFESIPYELLKIGAVTVAMPGQGDILQKTLANIEQAEPKAQTANEALGMVIGAIGTAVLTDTVARLASFARGAAAAGVPKPSPNFRAPTNAPQAPPASLPKGHSVRVMPPTQQYKNGYWVQTNQHGQPVNPATGKPPANVTRPEARAQTHVPLPPKPE